MKTKQILFLMLIFWTVLPVSAKKTIQHKPFFGKDSTVCYYHVSSRYMYDASPFQVTSTLGRPEYGWKTGFLLYLMSINENNSKQWIVHQKDSTLIVDMDLVLGDSFMIMPNRKYAVEKVYWENGRKHIQFDFKLWVEVDSLNAQTNDLYHQVTYEFVEGVGTLYPDIKENYLSSDPYPTTYGGRTIRGIVKDGVVAYIHPLWKNNWNYVMPTNLRETTDERELEIYFEGNKNLRIDLCSSSSIGKPLKIFDLSGNLLFNDILLESKQYALSFLPEGIYIVKIDEYTTKISLS